MSRDNGKETSETGRKIESQLENPIDNVLINIADKVSPIFKKLNFTPNGITILSGITGLGALYSLHQKDTTQFTIYLILSYFLSVLDKHYAEKYNMGTDNGERYNNYKDILLMAAGAFILYSKYDVTNSPILIIVLLCLFFLSAIYLGCQEVLISNENNFSKSAIQNGASLLTEMDIKTRETRETYKTCKTRMGYLRWFGPGSMILIVILAVLYLNNDLSGLSSNNSNVVPGSDDILDELSTSDNTLPEINSSDVVDIRGFNPDSRANGIFSGINRENLEFLNDLRNFGSANIGTSTIGPYSTSMMVDRMIRD